MSVHLTKVCAGTAELGAGEGLGGTIPPPRAPPVTVTVTNGFISMTSHTSIAKAY
jgi:hypothetical protein